MSETTSESVEKPKGIGPALARLAADIFGENREKVKEQLKELEATFSDNTDPEATRSELEAAKATAVVNFIRSLFEMDPLKEGEVPDLSKDLTVTPGKPSVLKVGDKDVKYKNIDFTKISEIGPRIVQAGLTSIAMKEPVKGQVKKGKEQPACCWDWIHQIYEAAGVRQGPVLFSVANAERRAVGSLDYGMVKEGAWLYIHNGNPSKMGEHSVVFSKWIDEENHVAEVMSYPGSGNKNPVPRVHNVNFEEEPITRLSLPV